MCIYIYIYIYMYRYIYPPGPSGHTAAEEMNQTSISFSFSFSFSLSFSLSFSFSFSFFFFSFSFLLVCPSCLLLVCLFAHLVCLLVGPQPPPIHHPKTSCLTFGATWIRLWLECRAHFRFWTSSSPHLYASDLPFDGYMPKVTPKWHQSTSKVPQSHPKMPPK